MTKWVDREDESLHIIKQTSQADSILDASNESYNSLLIHSKQEESIIASYFGDLKEFDSN